MQSLRWDREQALSRAAAPVHAAGNVEQREGSGHVWEPAPRLDRNEPLLSEAMRGRLHATEWHATQGDCRSGCAPPCCALPGRVAWCDVLRLRWTRSSGCRHAAMQLNQPEMNEREPNPSWPNLPWPKLRGLSQLWGKRCGIACESAQAQVHAYAFALPEWHARRPRRRLPA
jgi:hypothetical protein